MENSKPMQANAPWPQDRRPSSGSVLDLLEEEVGDGRPSNDGLGHGDLGCFTPCHAEKEATKRLRGVRSPFKACTGLV